MDGAAGWFNSRSAQALQEDLTSLRLNNGPGVAGWVGGGAQGGDKCTVTFSSLQRPLMCDLREVY